GREERRAPLAPQHPDEARMEIGAVSPLVLTGPDGVTAAPPGSALVIAHRAVDVVVKGPDLRGAGLAPAAFPLGELANDAREWDQDRKSTRLNSSHQIISYAVFCLK